jgi:hypothetical protein
MSEDEIKKEIRQMLMLISSIRSTDNERYEEHVNFSNEVIGFIKKIQENMNENWDRIHKSLSQLNKTIEDSLDSLLTGINPEGIRETSQSLKEIMDTMGKSIQSMNLENVMRQLQGLTGQGITIAAPAKGGASGSSATPLKAGMTASYGAPGLAGPSGTSQPAAAAAAEDDDGLDEATRKAYIEAYGEIPPHLKKKKKKDQGLLKPSDFFGM